MKPFELLKIHLNSFGILQTDAAKKPSLNPYILIGNLSGCLVLFFVSTAWFFVFSSKSNVKSAQSLYFTVSALVIVVWYSICLWNGDKYDSLFADSDAIIEKSMLKIIFFFTFLWCFQDLFFF